MHPLAEFERLLSLAFAKAQGIQISRKVIGPIDLVTIATKEDQRIAYCTVKANAHEDHVRIWDLNVHLQAQRTDLKVGKTITRAAAIWAEQLGKSSVAAMSVCDDGLSFWPYMGAQPAKPVMERLTLAFISVAAVVPPDEKEKLQALNTIALTDKKAAWFAMTDKESPLRVSRQTVSTIGYELYKNQTLYLDLKDPTVRSRIGLGA